MGSKSKLEKRLRNAEYAKKFKKKKKRAPRPTSSVPQGGAEVICASCGVQTHVPFQPTNGKPVYCRPCFNKPQPTVTAVTMAPAVPEPIVREPAARAAI